jgi:hypothetical protein
MRGVGLTWPVHYGQQARPSLDGDSFGGRQRESVLVKAAFCLALELKMEHSLLYRLG